uniref:Uncharacterized protein n=1 Tax=Setaria italica TaxID=4555 RepID=K3ZGA5_SETIT
MQPARNLRHLSCPSQTVWFTGRWHCTRASGCLRTEGELFKEFKMQLMVLLISQET